MFFFEKKNQKTFDCWSVTVGRSARALLLIFIFGLALRPRAAETTGRLEWRPPDAGVVPTANTAVRVATAVLETYNDDARREVARYQPWTAELAQDGNWEVRGTLAKNSVGGTYVVVSRSDGRIITIFHEQ